MDAIAPTDVRPMPEPATDTAEWDRNLWACLRLYEAYNATLDISTNLDMAAPEYAAAEAVTYAAMDASCAAERTMLETPAPHLAAVLRKLEIATERTLQIYEIAPVLGDLRRLGGC